MFFIYKYLFKAFSWFIILLLLAIVVSLFSCNPQKHWRDRGIRKGWIDTSKVKTDTVFLVKVDTVGLDKAIDSTTAQIQYILDSAGCETDTVFIHKIKRIIEKQIVKHYIIQPRLKMPQDTAIIHDKNGNSLKVWFVNDKMNLELITSKDNFKDIPLKWYQKFWWIWLLLLVAVLLSFWLAKKG